MLLEEPFYANDPSDTEGPLVPEVNKITDEWKKIDYEKQQLQEEWNEVKAEKKKLT